MTRRAGRTSRTVPTGNGPAPEALETMAWGAALEASSLHHGIANMVAIVECQCGATFEGATGGQAIALWTEHVEAT